MQLLTGSSYTICEPPLPQLLSSLRIFGASELPDNKDSYRKLHDSLLGIYVVIGKNETIFRFDGT